MKKSFKNILSAAALLMLTATSAFADGEDKGVVANKKVSANEDGTYTLTLEAYATGSSITTVTEESVPLDIVLVLDVSGSMDENIPGNYVKTKDNIATVMSNFSTKDYYYYTNSNYYKITKVESGRNGYTISYYRNRTRTATVSNSSSIYEEESAPVKKLQALKDACKVFISNVAKESNNDCMHKISIVKFAGPTSDNVGNDRVKNSFFGIEWDGENYSQVVMNLTDSKSSVLTTTIDALVADGATHADYGMEHAAKVLSDNTQVRADSKKIVVMFTDGTPTSGNTFEASVANGAITASKSLKEKDVVVYTVGVFGGDQSDEINQYMSAVSSDVKTASEYTDGSSSDPDGNGYYMTASNSSELENIFDSISKESTEGATKSTLTATNSSVRDFVTPEFKIVGTAENIELEVWPSDSTHTGSTPSWLAAQPATGVTATIGDADEYGNTPVIVTGFDYSANWVGPKKTTLGDITGWRGAGKKLVIKIKIKLDENTNSGGVLQTNTEFSGIYSGDGLEKDFESTGIEFPVPQAVSKSPAVLIIKKETAGAESAIFDVYAAGEFVNTVMVNKSTGYKAEILVEWLKDDAPNAINVADLDGYMIPFSVVERANWTWNTPATVDAKPLYIVSGSGDTAKATENNVFEFGPGTKSAKSDVNHDEESAVINR